jgi:O-glycosyl hydrolase
MLGVPKRNGRIALAVLVFTAAACGSDRGVPENVAGGYTGGGVGGLTGGCYVNPNPNQPNDGAAVVTLDPKTKFQTMQGFGASMRLFDDPRTTNTSNPATGRGIAVPSDIDQNTLLDLVYVDAGLTRVRFLPGDGGTEASNDNADPAVADSAKFDFSWTRGDGQIALMPGLVRRGVTTHFIATPALESWMTTAAPEEYAEWLFVSLRHWRDRGYELPYVSLRNEPGKAAGGGVLSGAYLRDVTKLLGARIKADGMKTKIVVPDDASAAEAYGRLQVILADADARQYVGAVAYHLGDRGGELQVKQIAEQYGIPVWVTAYSASDWFDLATTVNQLITDDGVSAVDYTWGLYGDHEQQSQLVRLIASNGAYQRYERSKEYYAMGQFSRFVPPGAVRIGATSSDPFVKASAYVNGTKLIVIVMFTGVPGSPFERPVRIELGPGGPCVKRATIVRTSDAESWLALPQLFTDIPRLNVTLPVHSIVTFVGQE